MEVLWVPPEEKPPPHAWRFSVRFLDPRPRSAAVQYFESRRPFEPLAAHDGKPVVALFREPAFDEVVALAMWLWERSGRGRPSGKAWEAVAYYADNVRQGLLPEKVDPTVAPQSVYKAIVEERLARDPSGFLEHAVWLVEVLVEKTLAGRGPRVLLEDDLVSDEPFLGEYLMLLRPDEGQYRDDLQRRARRYIALVPDPVPGGPGSPRASSEPLPLLAVRNPRATRFRMWAQRDSQVRGPWGEGWPLLVVQKPPLPGRTPAPGLIDVQVTATAASKATLSFLVPSLNDREREVAGPGAERWYAGEDYGDRMVASPESGTRLSFDQVLEVLSRELSLRPSEPTEPVEPGDGGAPPRRWRRPGWKVALGSIAAVSLILAPGMRNTVGSWLHPIPRPPADGGSPRPEGRGISRPGSGGAGTREAFLARKDRALLVATERYQDRRWPHLDLPVKQARLLRAALERRGFDVKLLENPTLGEFMKEFVRTTKEPWSPYDQFVLYFAGHGTVNSLGSGRLVLADSSGDDSRYLSLAELRVWLRDHTSRHVLLVLDSCYAGAISLDPPQDLRGTPAPVRYRSSTLGVDESAAWRKLDPPVRRYLTAVGRDVTPDDSRFTQGLIEMLGAGEGQTEYATDLSLAARLQGVHPSPQYGRFEGDEADGAVVFRPPR